MGRDKSLIEIGGSPLAVRVARALGAAGAAHVVAVGGDGAALRASGLEAIPDDTPGEGPLGGILTAFRLASDDVVVVLACDLLEASGPAIEAVVTALHRAPRAAVAWPELHGRAQPLHAAWRVSLAGPPLRQAFDAGERSPSRASSALPLVVVHDLPRAALDDADRPEDLPRR